MTDRPIEKPRLLVIERDSRAGASARDRLSDEFQITVARSMARALVLLREREFSGVYVDSTQLSAVRWAGVMIQADEILEAIADGVAVVDTDLNIVWVNPEFHLLVPPENDPIGRQFYRALGSPEIVGTEPCPFTTAVASRTTSATELRVNANRFLRVTVTPVFDRSGTLTHHIALTRDITSETLQQQKIDAIHKAGDELADLKPEELAEMGVEERTDLLKYNIARHMRDLLGLDFIEIRLLDRTNDRLVPLLTEGMTPRAATRELFARKEGNGVTGFVAATGLSYLCTDTANDPLYLEGAAGARSSLTVPLNYHGTVIGTLNVENGQPNAFDEKDRQFLEIYARNIAAAINTLELLQAEKIGAASASVEAISRELALPLDEIISDATTALDRYAGHDEDIIARLKHLLYRAREIRGLIHKAGSEVASEGKPPGERVLPKLAGSRVLVVDADEAVRRAAHQLLGRHGAIVETAQNAHEAIALARQTPYSAAMTDIRLPDLDGYEIFRRLREVQPGMPIIMMTGFGYDPAHAIVKARREGMQSVLYKPFRVDRLIEAIELAVRPPARPEEPPPAPPETPPPGGEGDAKDSPPSPPPSSPEPTSL
ncbi:response regulator [Isosphaeraceae bacterium EP7]